jgi:hypothetical protein
MKGVVKTARTRPSPPLRAPVELRPSVRQIMLRPERGRADPKHGNVMQRDG